MFPLLALIASILGGAQDFSDDKPYVVVYPVQDLEMIIPVYTDAPKIDLNNALNKSTIFRDNQTNSRITEKDSQAIISLIENTVEPEVWGTEATIRYWKGNLIVNAPKRIHVQIK